MAGASSSTSAQFRKTDPTALDDAVAWVAGEFWSLAGQLSQIRTFDATLFGRMVTLATAASVLPGGRRAADEKRRMSEWSLSDGFRTIRMGESLCEALKGEAA